jgi:LmbE family N-acetylglucosaminyl deacetylase
MKPERILAVVAHADDEVLGCGGTLARHSSEGHEVRVLAMADGVSSRLNLDDDQRNAIYERMEFAKEGARILGISAIEFVGYPDNQMDAVPLLEVIQRVEAYLKIFPADTVYTHHCGDLNIDHCITGRAVVTATRPLPNACVQNLYAFEVPSSTEWRFDSGFNSFQPNFYMDISDTLDRKIEALKAYKSEVKDSPHPRSIEACKSLARFRGSNIGMSAAEAFMLVRAIRK